MRATGIVRQVDDLGRVVIPIDIRRNYDINIGDPLEIYLEGEHIMVIKHVPSCLFCDQSNRKLIIHHEKQICVNCIEEMSKQ